MSSRALIYFSLVTFNLVTLAACSPSHQGAPNAAANFDGARASSTLPLLPPSSASGAVAQNGGALNTNDTASANIPLKVVRDLSNGDPDDIDAGALPPQKGVIADPIDESAETDVVADPAPPAKVSGPRPAARAQSCGAIRPDNGDFFPGLPFEQGEAQLTGGVDRLGQPAAQIIKNPELGLQFVDSARDTLLAAALDRADQRDPADQRADRALALRIRGLRVHVGDGGLYRLTFNFESGPRRFEKYSLQGTATRDKRSIQLRGEGAFLGAMTCMDTDGGCENAWIALKRRTRAGDAIVQIVHRFGSAFVTMSDEDRFHAEERGSRARQLFAGYLAHTANNNCLIGLARARSTKNACLAAMTKICGQTRWQAPAAANFRLRTYAIAYGRAGFEFSAVDQIAGPEHFVISGPLGVSNARPMVPQALTTHGVGEARAELVATDGAGDLNLRLQFGERSEDHLRLSVSGVFKSTRAMPTDPTPPASK